MRFLPFWVALLLLLCGATVTAQIFEGYSGRPGDQESMSYAADLEGRAQYQLDGVRVDSQFSLANAATMSAEAFRDGATDAVRSVNVIQPCDVQPSIYHFDVGGWMLYDDAKRPDEIWRMRFRYRAPDGDQSTWKRPVVVVNDGMGLDYSTGYQSRGYAGENVAQILRDAGHPVLVMALKGFDDKYFRGGWGVNGIYQFDAYMKARGKSIASEWIQDAFDAVCLMRSWFPDKSIGITGVSKSGIVAASAALLHPDVDSVYLASGFSDYEAKFYALGPWGYAWGERVLYERNALLAAMYDKRVRLSYSQNDDISYRIESDQGRVLNAVNAARTAWGKPQISQFSAAPSHYYSAADVTAFFAAP